MSIQVDTIPLPLIYSLGSKRPSRVVEDLPYAVRTVCRAPLARASFTRSGVMGS